MTVVEPMVETADMGCDAATPVSFKRRKSIEPAVVEATAPVIIHWSERAVDEVANVASMPSAAVTPVTPVQYAYCVVVPMLGLLAIMLHDDATVFDN